MNYDAIAVGPLDLAQGVDFLLDSASSLLPWVSANIYAEDGTRIFPPYLTFEKSGLSIAVIGISNRFRQDVQGVILSSWEKELADLVPSLSTSHDMVLLLTTLSYKSVMAITEKFPDIQIILSADLKKGNINGPLINNTVVAQTASQGKYLGRLTVNWRNQPWAIDLTTKRSTIERQLKSINRQRVKLERDAALRATGYEQKKTLLVKKREQLTGELQALEKTEEAQMKVKPSSTYSTAIIPLTPSIPEHPEIKSIVVEAENKSAGIKAK